MAPIDIKGALAPVPAAENLYAGVAILGGNGVAFGGHIAAQSLSAAACEVGRDLRPNSIHSTFLSPVEPGQWISHEVTWLKRGRAFSVLRVDVRQRSRVALTSVISFHERETGPSHQMVMPVVEKPQFYPELGIIPPGTNPEVRECFEIRSVGIAEQLMQQHPTQTCWFRCRQPFGDTDYLHAAALIWFSDPSMPWTTDLPYSPADGKGSAPPWIMPFGFTDRSLSKNGCSSSKKALFTPGREP